MTGCYDYTYRSFEGYQVAKIPYDIGKKDDKKEFSMFIFLPNEKDGLPSLFKKVNSDPKFFTQNFRLRREPLDAFYTPKFKFSYTAMKQVIKTMREMGLTLRFDKKCEEITKIMEPHGPFFINRILQKAFIEVNEKGTVAAAVTEEFDDDLGFPMCELPRFVADHPFLFMIRGRGFTNGAFHWSYVHEVKAEATAVTASIFFLRGTKIEGNEYKIDFASAHPFFFLLQGRYNCNHTVHRDLCFILLYSNMIFGLVKEFEACLASA
ncbi:serpin-Z3-like [Capsicum annuum]|uniref:serpin-Z3-like n=1 Tax=Capsicum annuum TaxID=4072 RepID=UPI0007BF70BA|nr:serpin-Z3-like [Capsicum annuum]